MNVSAVRYGSFHAYDCAPAAAPGRAQRPDNAAPPDAGDATSSTTDSVTISDDAKALYEGDTDGYSNEDSDADDAGSNDSTTAQEA